MTKQNDKTIIFRCSNELHDMLQEFLSTNTECNASGVLRTALSNYLAPKAARKITRNDMFAGLVDYLDGGRISSIAKSIGMKPAIFSEVVTNYESWSSRHDLETGSIETVRGYLDDHSRLWK
jgi:hypothetical protein